MGCVCEVKHLGLVDYSEGLTLQNAFVDARKRDLVSDTLLLLEHPHVVTFGRNAQKSNLIAENKLLEKLGVEVHETGRGGDVTYHGPGQVVGYPIINLSPDRCDVHKYVRDIEEVMLRTAADFGISANRIQGLTGIWVGQEKLAAIGVRISRWVTMHGFAFNVTTNLDYFKLIVPCGISDRGVTSLEKLLGKKVPLAEVEQRLALHFGQVFDRKLEQKPLRYQSVQVLIFDDSLPTTEFLLLKRNPQKGAFWQPVTGGIKVKRSESPEDAAIREVKEETSLQGQLIDLNYTHSFYLQPNLMKREHPDPQVNREYSFALRTNKTDVIIDPKEHDEYAWLTYEEAKERLIWNGNLRALELTKKFIEKS